MMKMLAAAYEYTILLLIFIGIKSVQPSFGNNLLVHNAILIN
jgi:hypothetical protein